MQKLGEREPARTDGPLAVAPALSVQFFLIPLAVVAVVVAVYGGFRLIANAGEAGVQEVPHLHVHILAGRPLGRMLERG